MDTSQAIQEEPEELQERSSGKKMSVYKEFTVKDFHSLHDALSVCRSGKPDTTWVFRGHSDPTWKLVPRIGRPPFAGVDERDLFETWKRRAIEYVAIKPDDDWDWLAIAQHHGLATRLLDWTFNPLNAAYFAVVEEKSSDAVLYAARFGKVADTAEYPFMPTYIRSMSPFQVGRVYLFLPMGVAGRITRQQGLFTIHGGHPASPLEAGCVGLRELHRIVIDQAYRSTLLRELSFYGVNSETLFPDLDGLSSFVNWTVMSKDGSKSSDRVLNDGEVAPPQSNAVSASSMETLEK